MQVDAGLLRAAMAHQRGDHTEVDTAIHEVRGIAVAERLGLDVGGKAGTRDRTAHHVGHVLVGQAPLLCNGSKQRSAPAAALVQVGEQLGVHGVGHRHDARLVALGGQDAELATFRGQVLHVEPAELVGAQPTAVQQQHDRPVAAFFGRPARTGLDERPGLVQCQRARRRALLGVLQVKAAQHVAIATAAAPGILEQATRVRKVLVDAGRAGLGLALQRHVAQEILQGQLPQGHVAAQPMHLLHDSPQAAANVPDSARRQLVDVLLVIEIALDQGIEPVHAVTAVLSQSLSGCFWTARCRSGSAMCR